MALWPSLDDVADDVNIEVVGGLGGRRDDDDEGGGAIFLSLTVSDGGCVRVNISYYR